MILVITETQGGETKKVFVCQELLEFTFPYLRRQLVLGAIQRSHHVHDLLTQV